MKSNPILEEVWRTKDEMAREADYDLHRLCENTRQWAEKHPHSDPVMHTAEELRQFMAEQERKRVEGSALLLKDEPPRRKA